MNLINNSRMASLLIFAGVIPFIVLTAITAYDVEYPYFESKVALKSYALAIGSFVCGSHWGIYLIKSSPINLLITSNICTLTLWVAFLYLENYGLFFSIIFSLLLLIDFFLYKSSIISIGYFGKRKIITLIVVLCLVFNFVFN